jgi:hypothetical protein
MGPGLVGPTGQGRERFRRELHERSDSCFFQSVAAPGDVGKRGFLGLKSFYHGRQGLHLLAIYLGIGRLHILQGNTQQSRQMPPVPGLLQGLFHQPPGGLFQALKFCGIRPLLRGLNPGLERFLYLAERFFKPIPRSGYQALDLHHHCFRAGRGKAVLVL